jgi:predicted enzyme related to lactoylglutathione lyase
MNFHPAAPILRVADLRASLAYYIDILGFTIDWEAEGPMASVSRDRCCLFLTEGDQGHPGAWVWIGVADAEALHAELVAKGAKIRQPPTNFRWALEIQVEDLDGNILRLGSEPLADRPFGPWKDMHGRLWAHRGEGRWERME